MNVRAESFCLELALNPEKICVAMYHQIQVLGTRQIEKVLNAGDEPLSPDSNNQNICWPWDKLKYYHRLISRYPSTIFPTLPIASFVQAMAQFIRSTVLGGDFETPDRCICLNPSFRFCTEVIYLHGL